MTPKPINRATVRQLIAACQAVQDRLAMWMEIAEPHDRRKADDRAMQRADLARLKAKQELTRSAK